MRACKPSATAAKGVLAAVFACSAVGSMAYVHHSLSDARKQIEALQKKNGEVSARLDVIAREMADKQSEILSLEERLAGLNPAKSVEEYRALEASVQINYSEESSKSYVVSGSIIYSMPNARGFFDNYALSVAHGFDILSVASSPTSTAKSFIKVQTYKITSDVDLSEHSSFEGKVVLLDSCLDVAIVYFESLDVLQTARIAEEVELQQIPLYAKVFIMGCPLGLPVSKTEGEVQMKCVIGEDGLFWRTSAPTVPGNSGGGVYLKGTNTLIGVSKGCGSFGISENLQIPIAHVNYMIPVTGLREWLEENNLGFLMEKD